MARSHRSGTSGGVQVFQRTQRYFWPEPVLNTWNLLILACGITQIVVFAMNLTQQAHFQVGVPWLFPYGITVGALTLALIIVINILMLNRNLIPGVIIMLSILFFALYITSTIETGLILFGPGNNVDKQCRNAINGNPIYGQTVATLAWLELNMICNGWYAVFSFNLIGTLLFFFMIFFALGVSRNQVDDERDL